MVKAEQAKGAKEKGANAAKNRRLKKRAKVRGKVKVKSEKNQIRDIKVHFFCFQQVTVTRREQRRLNLEQKKSGDAATIAGLEAEVRRSKRSRQIPVS